MNSLKLKISFLFNKKGNLVNKNLAAVINLFGVYFAFPIQFLNVWFWQFVISRMYKGYMPWRADIKSMTEHFLMLMYKKA